MRMHSLELSNFCQHPERMITFAPGLNMLIGPNGSGKTNILRALQFALTGDAGGERPKADDVYQGMGEGGGAPLHAIAAAVQDALFDKGVIVRNSHCSSNNVFDMLQQPNGSEVVRVESRL